MDTAPSQIAAEINSKEYEDGRNIINRFCKTFPALIESIQKMDMNARIELFKKIFLNTPGFTGESYMRIINLIAAKEWTGFTGYLQLGTIGQISIIKYLLGNIHEIQNFEHVAEVWITTFMKYTNNHTIGMDHQPWDDETKKEFEAYQGDKYGIATNWATWWNQASPRAQLKLLERLTSY